VGVSGVDVQVCSIVLVALGHFVLPILGKRIALASGVSYLTNCKRWSIEYTTVPCFTSVVAGPTARIEAPISDPSSSIAIKRKPLLNTKHPTEERQRFHRGGPSLIMRLAERFIFGCPYFRPAEDGCALLHIVKRLVWTE
jgi:hypothetical protein